MFDLAWKFKQIGVVEPKVNLAISSEGKLNWDDLLDKVNEGPKQPSSGTIPSIVIQHIIVSEGNVHYADANRPSPIETTLSPLNFQLKGFSTLPRDRGDYLISAAFDDKGGSLKWKGNMGVNPVASAGVVSLEKINIADAIALVKGLDLPVTINKGDVQTSFSYDFTMPKTVPTLALTNLTVGFSDVAGKLVDDGNVNLVHGGLTVPRLNFVKDEYPKLQIENLDLKVLGFNLSQGDGTEIQLQESVATLPKFNLEVQDQAQLLFQNLNIKLNDFTLNQGKHLALRVPTSNINAVNLDLAENKANIGEIVLSNIQFGKAIAEGDENKADVESIATLKEITLADGQFALADKTLQVESVLFSGLDTSVVKQSDGSLNWVKFFAENQLPAQADVPVKPSVEAKQDATTPNKSEEGAESPWAVRLANVALRDANIHIEDNSVKTPVKFDVQDASVALNDASLDMTKSLPIKAAFKVKQGGKFSTKGKLWPSPFKADLGLRLSNLSLKTFAPYLNETALLKLDSGTAGLSGKLNLKQKQDFSLRFNGKFDVKKLSILEEVDDKPFLRWNRLGSNQLKLSLMPNKLHMASLKIDQPSGKFIIFEDKSLNVNRIMRNNTPATIEQAEQSSAKEVVTSATPVTSDNSLIKAQAPQAVVSAEEVPKPSPTQPDAAVDSFPVSIDSVRINDAKLEFADLSLITPFGTNIHSLTGVMNGLSTKADKVAQVELAGKVDEYGSAKIAGSLQPFKATDFTDIKLAFTNLDMSRLTPYSGKFAGRKINSGKLSVDLGYKIKQQQLIGENKFVINKIKLGDKIESDESADLPLDLAIAILEDSDGVIDLDLPISGSLDDPEFSYGSIVWKAFTNILTKIVTAPFRALGSLFGGDGEDFDGIAFEAGQSEVSPPELEKLAKVSEALAKRQGLTLGIVPSYNEAVDTQAIQQMTYRRQVIEEMGVVLEEGQKPGPIDLGNEAAQDAIQTLHNKLTKKGFFKRMAGKFEKPEDGYFEKAQASLIESVEVTEADLIKVAETRAKAIETALLSNGINQERLSIAEVANVEAKEKTIKASLTLDVNKTSQNVDVAPTQGEATNEPIETAPTVAE